MEKIVDNGKRRVATNMKLTPKTLRRIAWLIEKNETSRTNMVERAVRELAKREGFPEDQDDKEEEAA